VSFPEHGVPWLKAKVDTGARTSSIHAQDPHPFRRDGELWVRFLLEPWQRSDLDRVEIEAPLHDQRWVRSSSGDRGHRPVIVLPVTIAEVTHDIELTLSQRPEMGFRMLLGRQALRGYYQVDPSRSYLGGRPPRAVRRRNRGRLPRSKPDPAESS
jgi:hypothetical protein